MQPHYQFAFPNYKHYLQISEIKNQIDVTDVWGVDGDAVSIVKNYRTKSDIHCYYLDENFKLKQLVTTKKEEK